MIDGSHLLRTIPAKHPTDDDAPEHLAGGRNRCHFDPGALAFLIGEYGVETMLDVGCGLSCMVEHALDKGVLAQGVDGDTHGKPDILWDFTHGPCPGLLDVDLVWSMEFLEHVDEKLIPNYMPAFQMGKVVMATHAPPGKLGRHHVNCQTQTYWEETFREYGFMFDPIATEGLREASRMQSVEWTGLINPKKRKRFIVENGMIFTR